MVTSSRQHQSPGSGCWCLPTRRAALTCSSRDIQSFRENRHKISSYELRTGWFCAVNELPFAITASMHKLPFFSFVIWSGNSMSDNSYNVFSFNKTRSSSNAQQFVFRNLYTLPLINSATYCNSNCLYLNYNIIGPTVLSAQYYM